MRTEIVAIGMAIGLAGAPAQAVTLPYSGLYVFGDSLVDAGNARIGSALRGLPEQAKPQDGYYAGRFSNGYTFADDLSFAIGGTATTAYLAGGTNFAVGGALTAYSPTEVSQSFLTQIGFFKSLKTVIDSNALVLVTFGGNDVRATAQSGTADFTVANATLELGLKTLVTNGARHILVTGLPDIGKLPSAQPLGAIPGRLDALTTRSSDLNALFKQTAATVAGDTGTDVGFFDLFDFEDNKVLKNPAAFGLTNTTTPCQVIGGGADQPCATSLYFDGIHHTATVHAEIADAIVTQLAAVPETATWTMMVLGFGLTGAAIRQRRREVALAA